MPIYAFTFYYLYSHFLTEPLLNLLSAIVNTKYREIEDRLVPTDSTYFIYDNEDKLEQTGLYSPDGQGGWTHLNYTYYYYNSNGRLSHEDPTSINNFVSPSVLLPRERKNYNYDTDGSLTYISFTDQDDSIELFRIDYTYDKSVNADEVLLPQFYRDTDRLPLEYKYMLLNERHWNVDPFYSNIHLPEKFTEYYYVPYEVSKTKEELLNFPTIYPNPATDFIFLDYPSKTAQMLLRIYDITGNILLEKSIQETARLDISQLDSGAYIYELTNGKTHYSGKLIKL